MRAEGDVAGLDRSGSTTALTGDMEPFALGSGRSTGIGEGRARRVLDAALEAFVLVDSDGRIVEWSTAAETMFGWSRAEALRRSWVALTVPSRLRAECQLDFTRFATGDHALASRRRRVRASRRDGSEFPAELSVSTIDLKGGRLFAALVYDLSEGHRAQSSHHLLVAIVESSQDAIVSRDEFGVVTSWNAAAERLFGYSAQEMIGQPIAALIPPELAAEEREILRRVILGESLHLGETERVRKDGARIAISLSVSPIRGDMAEIVGVAGIARDLTETKRIQDALQEAEALLEAAVLAATVDQARDGSPRRRDWSSPGSRHGTPDRSRDSSAPEWHDALERVCANPELLEPVFQPIVDLHRGTVAGYEMLARFRCPPTASPATWFGAAAAAHGFTPRLEAVVVNTAISARSRLPPNCFLSINVTPAALLSEEVQLAIAAGEDLRGVVFELTEQIAVSDYDRLKQALATFRHAGGLLAIDDVGAGYANLRHVMALRPDFVKLDRTLVSDIDRDQVNRAAVAALGALADRLDIWIVAEGPERTAELDALIDLGVPLAQGFAIARPSTTMEPIDSELSAHLRSHSTATRNRETLAGVIEATVAGVDREGADAIESVLAENPHLDYLPILDDHARPVALVHRKRPTTAIRSCTPMSVQPDTAPADAALRAITRPLHERFDPLVCCDEQGRCLGIIKIERLIETLADCVPTTRSAPR